MKRLSPLRCACALLLAALPALALASDQDVIQYREAIMKTLNEQSAALGQIASGVIPDTNLVAHMQIVALAASAALKAFQPKVPGGQAKPDVWTNWADFSKRMTDFAQETAKGVQIAKTQGQDGALTEIVAYANDCKGCHDMYRHDTGKSDTE